MVEIVILDGPRGKQGVRCPNPGMTVIYMPFLAHIWRVYSDIPPSHVKIL